VGDEPDTEPGEEQQQAEDTKPAVEPPELITVQDMDEVEYRSQDFARGTEGKGRATRAEHEEASP